MRKSLFAMILTVPAWTTWICPGLVDRLLRVPTVRMMGAARAGAALRGAGNGTDTDRADLRRLAVALAGIHSRPAGSDLEPECCSDFPLRTVEGNESNLLGGVNFGSCGSEPRKESPEGST